MKLIKMTSFVDIIKSCIKKETLNVIDNNALQNTLDNICPVQSMVILFILENANCY